jgi:hypothetical protein
MLSISIAITCTGNHPVCICICMHACARKSCVHAHRPAWLSALRVRAWMHLDVFHSPRCVLGAFVAIRGSAGPFTVPAVVHVACQTGPREAKGITARHAAVRCNKRVQVYRARRKGEHAERWLLSLACAVVARLSQLDSRGGHVSCEE